MVCPCCGLEEVDSRLKLQTYRLDFLFLCGQKFDFRLRREDLILGGLQFQVQGLALVAERHVLGRL